MPKTKLHAFVDKKKREKKDNLKEIKELTISETVKKIKKDMESNNSSPSSSCPVKALMFTNSKELNKLPRDPSELAALLTTRFGVITTDTVAVKDLTYALSQLSTWCVAADLTYSTLWDNNFKVAIPKDKKIVELVEIKTQYLIYLSELCHAMHGKQNYTPGVKIPYPYGAMWYGAILQGIYQQTLESCFNLPDLPTPKKESNKKINEPYLILTGYGGRYSEEAVDILDDKDPFRLLIKHSYYLSCQSGWFKKNYYTPFLKAYKAYIDFLRSSDYKSVIRDEEGDLAVYSNKLRRPQKLAWTESLEYYIP